MIDYTINPVLMSGFVKDVTGNTVIIHLRGRMGVLSVSRGLILTEGTLTAGQEALFYFSYLEVDAVPREYDMTELKSATEFIPIPVGGTLTEVNDTAVKCTMPDGCGTVAVPRRCVFTDVPLNVGETAGFYLSKLKPL